MEVMHETWCHRRKNEGYITSANKQVTRCEDVVAINESPTTVGVAD